MWNARGRCVRKIGVWTVVLLLPGLLTALNPAHAADLGIRIEPPVEAEDVFGEGTGVIHTGTLIAPQYYKNTLIHHVFFKVAFVVDTEKWQYINRQKLKLREVILDELNRHSFARPGARARINTGGLKKHLLRRAQALFGESAVRKIYLLSALSGRPQ